MKYGYSPLTFDYVFGKIGIENLFNPEKRLSLTETVTEAFKQGFRSVELDMDIFQILSVTIQKSDLISLEEFCMKTGFSLSVHMPYYSLDLAGPNEHIRKGSIQAFIKAYNDIKYLEPFISRYVIHPAGETTAEVISFFPGDLSKDIVKLFSEYSRLSLEEVFNESGLPREKAVLENVRFPLDATLDLVRETGTRFCLDTAHLLGGLSGKHDLMDTLSACFGLLGEIHFQEFDEETEHTALGTYGQITSSFFDYIYNRNFEGPVVFELPLQAVKSSIEYIREIFPKASAELPYLN